MVVSTDLTDPAVERVEEDEYARRLAAFRPVQLRSAADEVVAVLADAIRGGLYEPGDRLPRERDLAERLQVSRTVVRVAIHELRKAGVVSVRRGVNGGTVVESLAALPDVLAGLRRGKSADMRSLLEVRRPLELMAALALGARAIPEDLAELRRLVELLERYLDAEDEFFEVDLKFHLTLGDRSGSRPLATFLRSVLNEISSLRAGFAVGHVELRRSLDRQQHSYEAIASGDPRRIAASMDDHLAGLEEHFLGRRLPFPGEGLVAREASAVR